MKIDFKTFFLSNLFFTSLIYLSFLSLNSGYTPTTLSLAFAGAVSTSSILYLVLYLISLPLKFNTRLRAYVLSTLFILVNITLVTDFFIYKLFNFHINAMVINILTSPKAFDSIQFGIMPVVLFAVIAVSIIAIEIFLLKRSTKHRSDIKLKYLVTLLLVITLAEKLTFGFASVYARGDIISAFRVIPLYQPLTFSKFANRYLGIKAKEQAKYVIRTDAALNYPAHTISIDRSKKRFHIFIIAFDAARSDYINAEITPNLYHFLHESIQLKHHYSGGNSTRFGIFSLIYGLNATYWFNFLNAYQGPVLFDILKSLDYRISIFSSTNTNWPEFRKTCYVDIQDKIYDHYTGEPWQKDRQNIENFLSYIDKSPHDLPHFSFIFLDAPHGYSFPKEQNIFNAEKELNYLKVKPHSRELDNTIRMYKNALHYDDMLFGKFIAALKAKNLYDNAMIIFTSDHGQEFYEYGFFGHNTSFSPAQVRVPLLIKLPEHLTHLHIDTGALTSHQDIIPSILKQLGVTNPLDDFSNGIDLFDKDMHRDYAFSANWNNSAIITKAQTSLFSNRPDKLFSNTLRESQSYKKINGTMQTEYIIDAMKQNKKFLK
jgi:membrane-anchored protein YejM (alkaline phosphatase superfamily)